MKKNKNFLLLVTFAISSVLQALNSHGAIIIQDDLTWYANSTGDDVGFSINALAFQVNTDGEVTIDLLSVGAFPTPIDSYIRIANDDGYLTVDDFFALNDDGPLGDDGSMFSADSYYSSNFASGNYFLFVSGCCYSAQEAIDGYRLINGNYQLDELSESGLYGSYQVTLSGDITVTPVPLPASLWLFASALGITGLIRKKSR